jgi:hypothetical protein
MDINKVNNKYKELFSLPYFIDKSEFLISLNNHLNSHDRNFCFSYPPGFGKTQILNMCDSYYSKANCENKIFELLKISQNKKIVKHLHNHNVISINMFYDRDLYYSVNELISQLCNKFNLENNYKFNDLSALLNTIKNQTGEKFIILIDNYDYLFDMDLDFGEGDKKLYLEFLKELIINKDYVELSIMVGINTIRNITDDSELLTINNYSFENDNSYFRYFGFDKNDVDKLYKDYLSYNSNNRINRDDLDLFYGGYRFNTDTSNNIYFNPNNIIKSLNANKIMSYQNNIFSLRLILNKVNTLEIDLYEILSNILDDKLLIKDIKKYDLNHKTSIYYEEIKLIEILIREGYLVLDGENKVCIPNKECGDAFNTALLKLI